MLLVSFYLQVFGSAGVIGNPMGFARSLGLGLRDFLSMPARSVLQVHSLLDGQSLLLLSAL